MNRLKILQDKLDLSKKYPDYINKNVFKIGFSIFILFVGLLIYSFGFTNFIYIICDSELGCVNPYIKCQDIIFNPDCDFYKKNPCIGKNCDNYIITYNDYIGQKPPLILKNSYKFALIIFLLTLLFNHIIYEVRKIK